MGVFQSALKEMEREECSIYGPRSFKEYLVEKGLSTKKKTADYLSVDDVTRLAPELQSAKTMVFRLGSPPGQVGTSFALAKCESDWSDYFLIDDEISGSSSPKVFLPRVSSRSLFSFQLLPKLTETSLVNLAVGSGLLHHALNIDQSEELVVPATGRSTTSFHFRPNPNAPLFHHCKGQVEIDAIFMGSRNGNETLFVVEAKKGEPVQALAKHKLCYPLAALKNTVPDYIDIVLVYLRAWSENDGLHFLATECEYTKQDEVVISDLSPHIVNHLVLVGF